ncbi:MAG: beta-N-acetylhexosaminidase [Anaerolineales bacterium]
MHTLIPAPLSFRSEAGQFTLRPATSIHAPDDLRSLADYLAAHLRAITGWPFPFRADQTNAIRLELSGQDSTLGDEGYRLEVRQDGVRLTAARPAGLFYAIQTLRQLLPPAPSPESWTIDACTILDVPRFPWRGAMLDVARHFFTVEQVRRLIDQIALYKFNILHLHLTDDQGWRLEIKSWPKLAEVGGSSATRGDPGGYYTQEEYAEIVRYAAERFITLVPEIDMPSHTQAALAACPELKGVSKYTGLYTGTEVGFCSLNIHQAITYRFIEDVFGELADLTPGPYLHIGGDEAHSTPEADYRAFIERAQQIVRQTGKQIVAWEEAAKGPLLTDSLVQYWLQADLARRAAASGNRLIMSPATQVYLDIKYNASTSLGQDWTQKYIEVQDAYDWNPAAMLEGVNESSILGVEAPLWTETILTVEEADFMFFPRLCAVAEVGWTPQESRAWEDFRHRLATHGPRLEALGVHFYRSPQIPWHKS